MFLGPLTVPGGADPPLSLLSPPAVPAGFSPLARPGEHYLDLSGLSPGQQLDLQLCREGAKLSSGAPPVTQLWLCLMDPKIQRDVKFSPNFPYFFP